MTAEKSNIVTIMVEEDVLNEVFEVDFWSVGESDRLSYEGEDEAIEFFLDDLYDSDVLPEQIELVAYRRRKPTFEEFKGSVIERFIERLDEEYADPDGYDHTTVTKRMLEAEERFIKEVLDEYTPWLCEVVFRKKVSLKDWVAEKMPELLHLFKKGAKNERH